MDWTVVIELGFWTLGTLASYQCVGHFFRCTHRHSKDAEHLRHNADYPNTVDVIFRAIAADFVPNREIVDHELEYNRNMRTYDFVKNPEHSLPQKILDGHSFSLYTSRILQPIPSNLNARKIQKSRMKLLNNSIVFRVMVEGNLITGSPHKITEHHWTIATVGCSDTRFPNIRSHLKTKLL